VRYCVQAGRRLGSAPCRLAAGARVAGLTNFRSLILPPTQPISLVDLGHQNADARDQVNVAALVVILQIVSTGQVSVLDFEEVAAAAAREEHRMGEGA